MIKEKIKQRRLQLLVHSLIYYYYGDSIISDQTFDKWAKELVSLQSNYPQESKEVEYYNEFQGWDGTTGFHLTFNGDIFEKARRLITYKNRML